MKPSRGNVEEDIGHNPFLRALQQKFENLYRLTVEKGDPAMILVPCADCLEGAAMSQAFAQAHLLQAAHIPGYFLNLVGQGVEVKDSSVTTHLGFQEHRVCEVLQSESMYEYGNAFSLLIIDKPLVGKFKAASPGPERGSFPQVVAGRPNLSGGPSDDPAHWLSDAPEIEAEFFDQVVRFRKTFVQVPGCEQSTAERIREITSDTSKKLIKHHKLMQQSQQQQLDYHVSRRAYAVLHPFVFPHLQQILAPEEARLEKAIKSYNSVEDLVDAMGPAGKSVALVDIRGCSERLSQMDDQFTPHEKLVCLEEAHSMLQRSMAERARAAAREREGALEITGDDVLSLFILATFGSTLQSRLAHVAHVEMYLQGAASRSGSSEAARFEEAGYAVSSFQAALQFLFDERRPSAAGARGQAASSERATTTVFSSYLQTAAAGADGL